MTPMILLVALAASVPTMDLQRGCRAEQKGVPPEAQAGVYQSCLDDEQAAHDELRRQWTQFPAAARATCAELGGMFDSYVEVLICIEIETGKASGAAKPLPPPPNPAS